jgi:exodeoxyribonuclease VII large subunit
LRFLTVLDRKLSATTLNVARNARTLQRDATALERSTTRLGERRSETLGRLTAALNAHDPQRTLERGYALALGADGEPLASAGAVQEAESFELRMADGSLPAVVGTSPPSQPTLLPDSDFDGD